MASSGVFSSGRPTGHPGATAILKYIPRPRVPWQPSRFSRANLTESDLSKLWGRGRYRDGPGNYNSGYSTEKTHVLEDNTVNIIPKHELAKFMPDISLGPKALVTPVSLMSARGGHRVTHDLLHSYDPYIGRLQKPATVDHDNITVEDPNRVGLNAATLDCRGRIYRWLRRGPFFQEDQYFRRTLSLQRNGTVPVAVHEHSLMAKIVRLARKGHLKAACEEYRRITSIPPVQVYRALTSACIAGGQLADAVAIFEDGNSRLFYVARDGEVLHNLMRCAIQAKHRVRVMWVYNTMRGRYYENVLVRAEVDPIWRYRIASMALEYLLDVNAGEEARTVFQYLVEEKLIDCDVHVRVGKAMQEALAEGKPIRLTDDVMQGMAVVRNTEVVALQVATALYQRYISVLAESAEAANAPTWSRRGVLSNPSKLSKEEALEWLKQSFRDIDVLAVLRLARFRRSSKDLMAKDRTAYIERVIQWVELLSTQHQQREEVPLTYFRKSKPSMTNPNVRVAWLPEERRHRSLLASDEGFSFYHSPNMRLVKETFADAGETLQGRFLAQRPIHHEISAGITLADRVNQQLRLGGAVSGGQHGAPPRILHSSVAAEIHAAKAISIGSADAGVAAESLHPSASAAAASVASQQRSATGSATSAGDAPEF